MMRSRPFTRWRRALTWRAAALAGVALALPALAALIWIVTPLPPEMARPGAVPSVELLDRHGIALRSGRSRNGSRGGWVDLDAIDPDLIRSVLAVEDERFYRHRGVDMRATARAFRDNVRAGRIVSGASTITMQTARLLRDIPRTWSGKIRQALWALRLEAHLDKGSILEIYLNRLPLGQGAIGVAAAASLYFDASASELSLGRAALLAALAHAPSQDNPLVDAARAERRRAGVLARLLEVGYATPADVERALAEPVIERGRRSPFLAPHFTTRALLWVEEGGGGATGRLHTTLDRSLQEGIEAEVRHTVDMLSDRRVEHAAALVLDNETGSILAWVGSPNFWADTAGQVDMVVSRRQPGSALKPFLYALAFERGYSAASILPDVPKTYSTAAGLYEPRNYDRRFRGPVRAREALASSYNVPAVELAHRLGAGSFLAALRRAGFASLQAAAEHYGVGLALGNGDVTLLELANAYRALVNGGVWRPYRWLLDDAVNAPPSLDRYGPSDVLQSERRVVSKRAAYLVLDILSDPVARAPGFGPVTPFDLPFPVAVKTGTSRRFTDNWAIGVTRRFTVAVWVGNFSGRPMAGVSGITGAGPLLQRAVLLTARYYPPGTLPAPAHVGLVPVHVCRLSGLRAGSDCPGMVEWFRPGEEPARGCDWHRDGRTVLPAEYTEWLDVHAQEGGALALQTAVSELEPNFVAEQPLRIVSPLDGDRYEVPPGTDPRYASIALRAVGAAPGTVRWFIDGVEVSSPRWRLVPGSHTIRAEARSGDRDQVGIVVE